MTAPKCVLCGGEVEPWPGPAETDGYGHNPWPLADYGRACNTCNDAEVIPARFKLRYTRQ